VVVPEIIQLFVSIIFNMYELEVLYGVGISKIYGVLEIVVI